MMAELSLKQVAQAAQGQLVNGDCRFSRVCTDTRNLQAGDLFVALRGERFDAHKFLQQAADKQACGLVVEQADASISLPQLVVDDTTLALGRIARYNRELFRGPLVAITGSGGKTTVKTLLRNIFAQCGNVYATKGNLNNHIGVPLSLLELSPEHDFAVIEMGASGPREIAYLVSLAKPQVGMVNNALRAHVEGFGSLAGVAKAKGEMFEGLAADATAVINADDPQVDTWYAQAGERPRLTFSLRSNGGELWASDIQQGSGSISFVLHLPGEELKVNLQLMGKHNVANALAAAACAHAVGIPGAAIKAGLETSEAVAGRMQSKVAASGATIIDDSYNANPDAVSAAIDALATCKGRTVLVLGDMAELGSDSVDFHRDLGSYAKTAGIDYLVTVGELSRHTCEAFGENGQHFADFEQAVAFLTGLMTENTVALVKGSRSARMERVVAALMSGEE